MATVPNQLDVGSAQFAASAFPQMVKTNGTNFPVFGLAFDAAAIESAYWFFRAIRYGSGNLTVDIDWYADTASSGDVVWGAAIAVLNPNSTTTDIETKAFATASTFTDNHLGTTPQRLHRAPVVITNLDSIAADADVEIRIYRDATNGADTMTGDAIMTTATVSYSDV